MNKGRLNTLALWCALVVVAVLNWGPGWTARNGSGTYSVPNSFTAGSTITASDFNENFTDIANELTNSLAADGQTSMTGPLKGYSGTASAPGYTFSADTNSGMYRIGADNIGLSVGGTKIVDVATTGVTVTGAVAADSMTVGGISVVVPAGVVVPYAGSSAPSGYLLSYGQAISRTTYASLFTAISTTYGTGDGSTTFNVPDCRSRVIAGKDDMGGSAASRLTSTYFGTSAAVLGAVGGSESTTLVEANLPPHAHAQTAQQPTVRYQRSTRSEGGGSSFGVVEQLYNDGVSGNTSLALADDATPGNTGNGSGSSTAFSRVAPTIIMNCIIKY